MKKIAMLLAACMVLVCAFAGCAEKPEPEPEPQITAPVVNPMVESNPEDMMNKLGFALGEVDGAENVKYFVISDKMGDVQFDLNSAKIDARIQSASEYTDISGMFVEWESTEDVSINGRDGKLMKGTTDGKTVEACMWYDAAPGVMYSVTAQADDLDGFDITAVANQLFVPMQGEAG